MKFIIRGKNIDVTPALKETIEHKLGKLERYFTPETEIHVTLSVEREEQKIEVTIPLKGNIIRSEQSSNDMYVSIDLVEEIIERQLRKYKNKLVEKHQAGVDFSKSFVEDHDHDSVEDDSIQIIRTNALVSNQCFRKTHAFRWNFSVIISMYLPTLRQMKSMLYTRERIILTV